MSFFIFALQFYHVFQITDEVRINRNRIFGPSVLVLTSRHITISVSRPTLAANGG